VKLEMGVSVLQYLCENASPEEALEGEARMVLARRPLICTDPSPDVARVQSILDFRKKMWLPRKERTKLGNVAPKQVPQKTPTQRESRRFTRFAETAAHIQIPESIIRLCQRRAEATPALKMAQLK
jgi:hypothetical protein